MLTSGCMGLLLCSVPQSQAEYIAVRIAFREFTSRHPEHELRFLHYSGNTGVREVMMAVNTAESVSCDFVICSVDSRLVDYVASATRAPIIAVAGQSERYANVRTVSVSHQTKARLLRSVLQALGCHRFCVLTDDPSADNSFLGALLNSASAVGGDVEWVEILASAKALERLEATSALVVIAVLSNSTSIDQLVGAAAQRDIQRRKIFLFVMEDCATSSWASLSGSLCIMAPFSHTNSSLENWLRQLQGDEVRSNHSSEISLFGESNSSVERWGSRHALASVVDSLFAALAFSRNSSYFGLRGEVDFNDGLVNPTLLIWNSRPGEPSVHLATFNDSTGLSFNNTIQGFWFGQPRDLPLDLRVADTVPSGARTPLTVLAIALPILCVTMFSVLALLIYRRIRRSNIHAPTDAKVPVAVLYCEVYKAAALWKTHRAEMCCVVDQLDELLRNLCWAHRGYHIESIHGDTFHAVFRNADDALAMAQASQLEIHRQNWRAPALEDYYREIDKLNSVDSYVGGYEALWNGPRLKVALHSGMLEVHKDRASNLYTYSGSTLSDTQLILDVAQGGQILGSDVFFHRTTADPSSHQHLLRRMGVVKRGDRIIRVRECLPRDIADRCFLQPQPDVRVVDRNVLRSQSTVVATSPSDAGRTLTPVASHAPSVRASVDRPRDEKLEVMSVISEDVFMRQ